MKRCFNVSDIIIKNITIKYFKLKTIAVFSKTNRMYSTKAADSINYSFFDYVYQNILHNKRL